MRRLGCLVAVIALATTWATAAARTPPGGIAGRVAEAPTCPVESVPPKPQCAPRPLSARIRISRVGSHRRPRIVRSGKHGHFRVGLAPGIYEVQGLPGHSSLPRPPGPEQVRVEPGRYTPVTITYDTGIR